MDEGSTTNLRDTASARRIVVKVGTSLITSKAGGMDSRLAGRLARQIARLTRGGRRVILVTSGAIGSGMEALGLGHRPGGVSKKQAAAAVGQIRLMRAYDDAFRRENLRIGQMLLTRDDFHDRDRYNNTRNTLTTLLAMGALPVVNENDTVSVDEIKFGDNDVLSALVANLAQADLLVILSVVDGLLSIDPGTGRKGRLIGEVRGITGEILRAAGSSTSELGTGGMASKIEAARIVTGCGIGMVIANGRTRDVLTRLAAGEALGTYFHPSSARMAGRKRWIAYTSRASGTILVDAGARAALVERHKSLLPSGVKGVRGDFGAGDVVAIAAEDGAEFARGISGYSSRSLAKAMGRKVSEARLLLGDPGAEEVVHRDDMVIWEGTR